MYSCEILTTVVSQERRKEERSLDILHVTPSRTYLLKFSNPQTLEEACASWGLAPPWGLPTTLPFNVKALALTSYNGLSVLWLCRQKLSHQTAEGGEQPNEGDVSDEDDSWIVDDLDDLPEGRLSFILPQVLTFMMQKDLWISLASTYWDPHRIGKACKIISASETPHVRLSSMMSKITPGGDFNQPI